MGIKVFTIKSSQPYKIYYTYTTLKTELSENAPNFKNNCFWLKE